MIDSNVLALDLEWHVCLVLAPRTAQATDLMLDKDKEMTQSDDLLDTFGIACHHLTTYTTINRWGR
jgi:hypothetical protein